ncbi:flagellar hook-length control protein FliK [Burkholderia sp. MR1-5-21]
MAQPGDDAQAADAQRDERTLDLFGDPVIEVRERVPGTAREVPAAEAVTVADAHGDGQTTLDGFDVPAAEAGATGIAVEAGTSAALAGADREGVVAVDLVMEKAGGGSEADGRAVELAAGITPAGQAPIDAAPIKAARTEAEQTETEQIETEQIEGAPIGGAQQTGHAQIEGAQSEVTQTERVKPEGVKPEGAGTKAAQTKAAKTEAGQNEAAQAETARSETAPVVSTATDVAAVGAASTEAARDNDKPRAANAASQSIDPAAPVVPTGSHAASKSAEQDVASAGDSAQPATPAASPAPQPVASAAAFVTKPSSDRTEPPGVSPSLDADALVRPLSDRIAALQTETAALTRAADREMRRVNRLLLALAVVVLAGLVALVLQTIQIAGLKRDAIAQQQRNDRLVADLSNQQATLMTLEQHNEALLAQVDRLARSMNRQTPSVKHVRRGR